MRYLARALLMSALVSSCAPAEAPQPPQLSEADYGPGQHPYGVQGSITQAQFATLQGLAWPQTYDDIIQTFGFPTHRLASADYYRLEGTSTWVVIEYSGTQATGYRTE